MLASPHSASATNDELLERLARMEQENQKLKNDNAHLTESATLLREEVQWLKAQLFGRSSEKASADVSPDQHLLFNEVEVLAAIAAAEGEPPRKSSGSKRTSARRSRGARRFQIASHEFRCCTISRKKRKSARTMARPLERIGVESAEQYDFVPPKLWVLRHERPKYACPCCHQGVKIAPPPAHILPKCMASPAMLAQITTAKFVDGLPLTRQSKPEQCRFLGTDGTKKAGRSDLCQRRQCAQLSFRQWRPNR